MKKEIPKAYEPSKYEDGIYKKWEESGAFNPDKLKLGKNVKSYTISMPPPNVTGTLHMGHAVMLAIEDILTRYHRMKGERALWVPGTDHAAIATQTKVEKILKEEGVDRHKLGREKFLARVNKFAQESRDTIVNQVKKMGSSCDWSREAYTLDEIRTRAVRTVFKMMYDDGLIYRGERIVNWCPRCHSTLADDEVEYKAQKAKLYTFKYDKSFPIAISTTRPETKLGDTAVAVNPKDERYKKYVNKELEADFCGVKLKIKIIADKEMDMKFGTGAVGVTPAHSIADWKMAENHDLEIAKVIDEDGNIRREGFGEYSGKNVFAARKIIVEKLRKNNLIAKEEEIDNNLSLCYRCDTPIEPLPSLQWFIDVNKPIGGGRKKAPLIKGVGGLNTAGKSLKEIALEVVRNKKIRIIPERFEKNYFHWMDNLRDWCISRQIWFGHRIPAYYDIKDKQNRHCRALFENGIPIKKSKKDIIKLLKEKGITESVGKDGDKLYPIEFFMGGNLPETGWISLYNPSFEVIKHLIETLELLTWEDVNKNVCGVKTPDFEESEECRDENKINILVDVDIKNIPISAVQDSGTLDTWFSSGLWTFSTLAKKAEDIKIKDVPSTSSGRGKLFIEGDDFKIFHPTAVLETGYDILFFWVARMIIMTTYAVGDIPFQDVYLHGLIRDEKGRKMSKSLGNVIDPLDMIKKYGADATRLSLVVGTTPGNDMSLSEEKVAGFRNFANKLWNIARYIITNYELRITNKINYRNLTLIDIWIVRKMLNLINMEVGNSLLNYNFSQAGEKLREFTWSDLADWYLEASKFEKNEEKKIILGQILKDLLKLWHPFMPFVTEEIWSNINKSILMAESWPEEKFYKDIIKNTTIGFNFEVIQKIIVSIRNARAEHKVPPAKKIKAIIYSGHLKEFISLQSHLIKNLRTGISELEVLDKGSKIDKAIYAAVGDIEIYLLGAIDKVKEKTRIKKEIDNLEKLIKGTEAKLKNKEFVKKAPKEIVAKEKEKMADFKNELKKLKEQFKNL